MEEYPSLIWQTGLRENGTREAVVSEQVLIDLKLTGMVRADISAYPLIPCNRVEIEKRQRIFAKLLGEPSCLEVLSALKDAVLDCKRMHTAYTVAE